MLHPAQKLTPASSPVLRPSPHLVAMPEAVEDVVVEAPEPTEGEKVKKWIMRIAAIAVVLMAAEAAVLWVMLSPSSDADAAQDAAAAEIADGISDITAGSDLVEVPFDPPFTVTNATADLGTMVHVNFELVAGVSGQNETTFRQAVEVDYRNRLRQAINEIVRSASLEDLQDPDLNQLKRRIKEDLNKTLQSSYVVDVIVPKMQVHVQ